MPERQKTLTTVRVDASSIQGDGAYIEFRYYTWAERQVLIQKLGALPEGIEGNLAMNKLLMEEFKDRLVDWNLVDGEGKALPVGELGALIDPEVSFIFDTLQNLIMKRIMGIQVTPQGKVEPSDEIKN